MERNRVLEASPQAAATHALDPWATPRGGRGLLWIVIPTAFVLASYCSRHAITCDYDNAGMFEHFDRGGLLREYLPVPHFLLAPTTWAFAQLVHLFGPASYLQVWIIFAPLCVALATGAMYVTCHRFTSQVGASIGGAALFLMSGSTIYLLRVLEDNLLTTFWLSLLILILTPSVRGRLSHFRFAMVGLVLAIAVLNGFYALAWGVLPVTVAIFSGGSWVSRIARALLCAVVATAVFLLTLSLVTPLGQAAPINPLSRFASGIPNAALFQEQHPMNVRARYVLLGTYYSLYAQPARLDDEWNSLYPVIAGGQWRGLWMHALTACGIVCVMFLALTSRAGASRSALTAGCCVTLVVLTLLNFSAIDGSFIERFDHIPLLLAPLISMVLADHRPRRNWRALAVMAFLVGIACVNFAYCVKSLKKSVWQYADMRSVADVRRPQEPVIVRGEVNEEYDMDRLCMAASLWLGETDVYILPKTELKRVGWYAVAPVQGVTDANRLAAWFEQTFSHASSIILNQDATCALRPTLDKGGWRLERICNRHDAYLRATRPVRE